MRKDEILQSLKRIKIILKRQQRKPLTIQEASKYTGLSSSFLYKLTSKNEISFYKPNGKKIYFLKRDLDKYILRIRIKSNAEQKELAINLNFKIGKQKKK